MTPDQLRELADTVNSIYAETYIQHEAIDSVVAYLRAQADAQPVVWMYELDGCVDTPVLTVNRWTKCEEPWNESPLYLHPAPQPQPERHCIGNDPNCPCQDGDPCHYRDHGDTKAMPIPQPQPVSDPRPCTCHPDDNPPVPCAQQYALNECRAAQPERQPVSEPTEAQLDAVAAVLFNLYCAEGPQAWAAADAVLRAALAAKDVK